MTTTYPCHINRFYIAIDTTAWNDWQLPALCEHLETTSDTLMMIDELITTYMLYRFTALRLPTEIPALDTMVEVLEHVNMTYVDPDYALRVMSTLFQSVYPALAVATTQGPIASLRCIFKEQCLTGLLGSAYA